MSSPGLNREISIRAALMTDLPQLIPLDIAANAAHPIVFIPWKNAADRYGVFLARHMYFLQYPQKFQVLVAVAPRGGAAGTKREGANGTGDGAEEEGSDEEVVLGFLVGGCPEEDVGEAKEGGDGKGGDGKKIPEWNAVLPEGTNTSFFEYFLGSVKGDQKKFKGGDMWELESFSISPAHQRRGIGSKLIEAWLKIVDADEQRRATYVFSSRKGKGLYERFGWKVVGSLETGLEDWGLEGNGEGGRSWANWHLVRDGRA